MLNYLFDLLVESDLPGARLMHYTTFRALLAIVISLLVSAWFGSHLIKYFKKKQITETLREDDKSNLKSGVPTMGGLIIIIAILVPCLLIGRLNNVYMLLLIITTVWLGLLGFADDYIKTFKKNKDGIPGKVKIIAQVGLGLVIGLTLYLSPQAVMRENIVVDKGDNIEEVHHKAMPVKSNKTTTMTEVVHAGTASKSHIRMAKRKIAKVLFWMIVIPSIQVSTGRHHTVIAATIAIIRRIALDTVFLSVLMLFFQL